MRSCCTDCIYTSLRSDHSVNQTSSRCGLDSIPISMQSVSMYTYTALTCIFTSTKRDPQCMLTAGLNGVKLEVVYCEKKLACLKRNSLFTVATSWLLLTVINDLIWHVYLFVKMVFHLIAISSRHCFSHFHASCPLCVSHLFRVFVFNWSVHIQKLSLSLNVECSKVIFI